MAVLQITVVKIPTLAMPGIWDRQLAAALCIPTLALAAVPRFASKRATVLRFAFETIFATEAGRHYDVALIAMVTGTLICSATIELIRSSQ